MRRTIIRRLSLSFIVLLTFLPLFAGGSMEQILAAPLSTRTSMEADQISIDMASLERLYRYVDSIYIDEIDKQKMFNDLASALIASLDDPYSFYVPPSKAKEYQEETSGVYGGIGTYLNKPSPDAIDPSDPSTYMITIVSPFPGSPAQRAGLMAGDLISHIDGEKVDELTSYEASMKLRGEVNTLVTITVYRNGTSFDLTLRREMITAPTVDSTVIEGNIGYIILSEFTPQTGNQLLEHVQKLMKQGIVGLIIDERNNSGGAVDGALQSANIFLEEGKTLVTIQGKKGTMRDQRYISTGNAEVPANLPIVILTNTGSASSAEIFAAAMKDNGRATLIGTKTFGKGIVQDVFRFGSGFAQVTTAHYYTPNGENIHKLGIEPDILVEDVQLSDDEIPAFEQLMTDKVISSYVQENPEPSEENIRRFAKLYAERGIDEEVLTLLVRNEYLSKMPYDKRPIADATFDKQLNRAVQFIRTGQ
ncbi:MAG: S41 family peptidase [Sphaerochaeta sp.]|uniref:S41 family peptidase n=1 Tax=Sphaerochaeta sp. TaxID=1972642 RepID=UPI003D126FF7